MATAKQEFLKRLTAHINRKHWWHSPPQDRAAYSKRGKFYASTFKEAEFWGRPLDVPERVRVTRPLVGDEPTIMGRLHLPMFDHDERTVEERYALDAKMRKAALKLGYDSIVLMTQRAFRRFKETGNIPRSIELNVFALDNQVSDLNKIGKKEQRTYAARLVKPIKQLR
jgi:hypothetical protein